MIVVYFAVAKKWMLNRRQNEPRSMKVSIERVVAVLASFRTHSAGEGGCESSAPRVLGESGGERSAYTFMNILLTEPINLAVGPMIINSADTQHTTAQRMTGLIFDQVRFGGIQLRSTGRTWMTLLTIDVRGGDEACPRGLKGFSLLSLGWRASGGMRTCRGVEGGTSSPSSPIRGS